MNLLNDILRAARYELRAILANRSVLLVLGGGIFLYGLLYNYMYAPNVVRDVPVALVDESRSSLGRRYASLLDATPQVRIALSASDMPDAREAMKRGDVVGIVYIPSDFENRVRRGEEGVYVMFSSTEAFLYYANVQEASSGVMLALNDEVRPGQVVFLPSDDVQTIVQTPSVGVHGEALYNVTDGYATYLIPAVLMVILFQTLMMVVCMRNGQENLQGAKLPAELFGEGPSWRHAVSLVLGKASVYVGFYAVFSLFLLGFLPLVFGLPHLATPLEIIQLMIPYLLASSFFALSLSPFCKDSEAPLLFITFFSVGLIFLSGVSYPLELMPRVWRFVHALLPAASGTLAFIKLNSMDAGIRGIAPEWALLWMQCVVYFSTACVVFRRKLLGAKR